MSLRRPGPERRQSIRVFLALAAAAALIGLLCGRAAAGERGWLEPEFVEVFGNVEIEGTGFFEEPAFPRQNPQGLSLAAEATLLAEWNGGDTVFTLTPFQRIDFQDDARSHFDLRDFKIEHVEGDWAVTFGVDREFWGKVEVVHLVDIVNQTDQVEDLDDEDRLGQPLLKLSRILGPGELSAYYFPYQRVRTLPGPGGRLRFEIPFATERAEFETGAGEWTPSFAVRYTGVVEAVDFAVSAFHGVSRDPAFRFEPDPAGGRLVPVYSRITQLGLEAQYTSGATLWKGEAIVREGQRNAAFETETYGAATAGLEHTLFQVAGSEADLGLILEGAWDSRGDDALTAFERDVIGGLRLTLNDVEDTSLLLTGSVDAVSGASTLRLEAERRLAPRIVARLEAQGFLNAEDDLAGCAFADDSFVRLKLQYYF